MPGPVVKGAIIGTPILGGTGTGITYQVTKKTFLDGLGDCRATIVAENDSAWGKILTNLKSKSESSFKTEAFKGLLRDAKDAGSPAKLDNKKLHDFCVEKSTPIYWTIFTPVNKESEELLGDIRLACTTTISDILGTENYATEQNNLNSDSLKDYSEDSPKLTSELEEIKKLLQNSQATDGKDRHARWCKDTSRSSYVGDNDEYKIFQVICKKKTTAGAR